ncbi:MAG: hypothetical protein WCX63_03625 [Methanoregula sp.]
MRSIDGDRGITHFQVSGRPFAHARLWHPPLSDDAVLPVHRIVFCKGNTDAIARATAPSEAGLAQRGVAYVRIPTAPHLDFDCSKNFPAFQIFIQKIIAVRTFARNFFEFSNFQTRKKTADEISIQKFLGFFTFAPKIFR